VTPMRLAAATALALLLAPAAAAALGDAELAKVVREIDERQRNQGDWKALCYMEQKEKGKTDVVYELLVYRRDADDKQMFLFTKPKAEAGKGYLRIEKNLWLYDPSTGRWERRTERERIGGTNTRRGDLDESRIVEEYDAKWEADEKLGAYTAHKLLLFAGPEETQAGFHALGALAAQVSARFGTLIAPMVVTAHGQARELADEQQRDHQRGEQRGDGGQGDGAVDVLDRLDPVAALVGGGVLQLRLGRAQAFQRALHQRLGRRQHFARQQGRDRGQGHAGRGGAEQHAAAERLAGRAAHGLHKTSNDRDRHGVTLGWKIGGLSAAILVQT